MEKGVVNGDLDGEVPKGKRYSPGEIESRGIGYCDVLVVECPVCSSTEHTLISGTVLRSGTSRRSLILKNKLRSYGTWLLAFILLVRSS